MLKWIFFLADSAERKKCQVQTHESQRNRNATAITLGLARASLPRTVWHLLCSMRCRTALLAPPATWRNWLRTLWTAFASICVPTPTIQILPCTQELPWFWPWRAVAATPHPLQPNVRQSRCPRPPICSVLLPTLGKSSLCLSGLNQDCPIGVCCSRVRFACTCQRGSQCDVNRQLGPRVTWEILCQHLNASTISGWDTHVHVPQERVERHSCPCLPASASQHTFNWSGTFLQTSTVRTCGSVAAVSIKWSLTPLARNLCDCEWELQSFKEQHAEQVRLDGVFRCCGCKRQ